MSIVNPLCTNNWWWCIRELTKSERWQRTDGNVTCTKSIEWSNCSRLKCVFREFMPWTFECQNGGQKCIRVNEDRFWLWFCLTTADSSRTDQTEWSNQHPFHYNDWRRCLISTTSNNRSTICTLRETFLYFSPPRSPFVHRHRFLRENNKSDRGNRRAQDRWICLAVNFTHKPISIR